jgi:hypothetical protein
MSKSKLVLPKGHIVTIGYIRAADALLRNVMYGRCSIGEKVLMDAIGYVEKAIQHEKDLASEKYSP